MKWALFTNFLIRTIPTAINTKPPVIDTISNIGDFWSAPVSTVIITDSAINSSCSSILIIPERVWIPTSACIYFKFPSFDNLSKVPVLLVFMPFDGTNCAA